MTAETFRRLALALPEAVESSHMQHPDFRVGKKIFATLGYPDASFATVMLTPDDQERFCSASPAAFTPAAGAWGRRGSTSVRLAGADDGMVLDALQAAWRKVAPKKLIAAEPR